MNNLRQKLCLRVLNTLHSVKIVLNVLITKGLFKIVKIKIPLSSKQILPFIFGGSAKVLQGGFPVGIEAGVI